MLKPRLDNVWSVANMTSARGTQRISSLHTSHSGIIYEIEVNFKTKSDCSVLSLSCQKNDEAMNKNKLEEMNLGRRRWRVMLWACPICANSWTTPVPPVTLSLLHGNHQGLWWHRDLTLRIEIPPPPSFGSCQHNSKMRFCDYKIGNIIPNYRTIFLRAK